MTVKTDVSRFHIHDELTAPDGSARLIKSIEAAGGQVSKFVGVIAGSPALFRAYARMRSELRSGILAEGTRLRISLAVAERRGDGYSLAQHAALARRFGVGLDEISLARSFRSTDEREAALLSLLDAALKGDGKPPQHLVEETREAGWSDEEILEALGHLALNELQSLIANVAGLPQDQGEAPMLASAA